MASLKVQEVTLGYGNEAVLRNVSLNVGPGELLGLVGPNGSGKSTLIKAISGVISPWSGDVNIDDQSIYRLSPQSRARLVAVVPQNAFLPEAFTVLEIALMGRYPHLGLLRYESQRDLAAAWTALERTGMEALARRRVSELSGGERQRLLIARSLAQQTRILLLDEPTAHLDLQYQSEVMELIGRLTADGMATVVALHDLSLAARFCHRLVLLRDGAVEAVGAPQDVLTSENIEAAFGIRVLVYPDPLGNRLVVDPLPKKTRTGLTRIHVVGGGGRGTGVMRMLHVEGFEVTAGVLNEGDADHAMAQVLGIELVAIPPFAAIDEASHRRNLELVERAECTVVADVPFGWANLLNLEAAALAKRLVLLEHVPIEQRDFTGGTASDVYRNLKQRARVTTCSELLGCVEETLSIEEGVAWGKV
ncbi:MAG: ABC transporter ATP-binding protein [Chloroflexota bacterium]